MYKMSHSPHLPPLHPIAMTDWLPKLGEKAFLAWLHFHSWKSMHQHTEGLIFLPYSLNKIIRKLKVGRTTFFHQILKPLKTYGLIQVVPGSHSSQETHLILYPYPQNCQEKADKPLNPVNQADPARLDPVPIEHYPRSPWEPSPAENHPGTEPEPVFNPNRCSTPPGPVPITPATNPEQEPVLTANLERTNPRTIPNPSPVPAPYRSFLETSPIQGDQKDKSHHDDLKKPKEEMMIQDRSDRIERIPIPDELTAAIEKHPLLQERTAQILKAYRASKHHPRYTLESFLAKLNQCIRYPHAPDRFASYLQKALHNEWSKPAPSFPARSTTTLSDPGTRPSRVPPWVWKQITEPPEPHEDVTPEQKAEAQKLLLALGEGIR